MHKLFPNAVATVRTILKVCFVVARWHCATAPQVVDVFVADVATRACTSHVPDRSGRST